MQMMHVRSVSDGSSEGVGVGSSSSSGISVPACSMRSEGSVTALVPAVTSGGIGMAS